MKKLKLLKMMWGLEIKLLPMRLYNFKIKHFIKLYRSVEKTAINGDDFVPFWIGLKENWLGLGVLVDWRI